MALPVNIGSDICDVIGAVQEAFLAELSLKRYRQACASAVSEATRIAAEGATDAIPATFSNPMPWMMRAFSYTRTLDWGGDEVEASVNALPSQSIVMKYAMGGAYGRRNLSFRKGEGRASSGSMAKADYHRNALRILFILARGSRPVPDAGVEGFDRVFTGESRVHALDFWMRYPDYLADELLTLFEATSDPSYLDEARRIFDQEEPDLRRVPMLRFYFGAYEPLDTVLGILKSRGLVLPRSRVTAMGRKGHEFLVSPRAVELLDRMVAELSPLGWYEDRVALVLKVAGSRGGFTLKTRQHERREYHDTKVDDLIPTTAGRVRRRLETILEKA